jgi:hypothetical protein
MPLPYDKIQRMLECWGTGYLQSVQATLHKSLNNQKDKKYNSENEKNLAIPTYLDGTP